MRTKGKLGRIIGTFIATPLILAWAFFVLFGNSAVCRDPEVHCASPWLILFKGILAIAVSAAILGLIIDFFVASAKQRRRPLG